MVATAYRNVVVVTESDMENDALFRGMKFASKSKIAAMVDSINSICDEREAFEASRERKLADGSIVIGQSADIRHVQALKNNEAFARMCVALKVDPRAYIFPQSQDGGKSSSETSNLKSYKKAREIAEVIWNGSSASLEGVARVFAVCCFKFASKGRELIKREFCENFLTSQEFRSIDAATADLWTEIDNLRAKQMSTGAQTQASQMIRTLVALKSAVDVQEGRSKNVRVDPEGKVIRALMRRFGQVTDLADDSEVSADLESQAFAPEHVETSALETL